MPGDHKRKARPIAPATVTVDHDSIAVIVPDVLGKNASHVQSKNGARRISEQTEEYRKSVHDGVFAWAQRISRGDHLLRMATIGAWRLEVIGVWPTQNKQVGFLAPKGDADAAIPQALDALQHAGVLDDDARVVEVRAWNLYRKGVRATVMRLVRVVERCGELATRDMDIAHLLPLVPQSPEPPAKPARKRKTKSTC